MCEVNEVFVCGRGRSLHVPCISGFGVVPGGGCEGRWWDITWDTRGADVPSMTVDGTNLTGSDPIATVVTLIDGGMWLRPLRGDMLRLPQESPQVRKQQQNSPITYFFATFCLHIIIILGGGDHQ